MRAASDGGVMAANRRTWGKASASDGDELPVLTPGRTQPIGDLAQRGVGLDGLDDRGHEVAGRAGGLLEPGQRPLTGRTVALGAEPLDALDLLGLGAGGDLLEGRRWSRIVHVAVDPHDHHLPPLHAALDAPPPP